MLYGVSRTYENELLMSDDISRLNLKSKNSFSSRNQSSLRTTPSDSMISSTNLPNLFYKPNGKKVTKSFYPTVTKLDSSRSKKSNVSMSCKCILCHRQSVLSNRYAPDSGRYSDSSWSLDGKHFLNCLDNIKTSVYVNRENNQNQFIKNSFVEDIYSNIQNSKSQSNLDDESDAKEAASKENTSKFLSQTSRIKLWSPDDLNRFMNKCSAESRLKYASAHSNSTSTSCTSISREASRNMLKSAANEAKHDLNENDTNNRINLIRILKQLRLNPNLSPLLSDKLMKDSRLQQVQLETSASKISRELTSELNSTIRNFPRNPPPTPF